MKEHLLTIALALTTGFLQAQIVNIPDISFKYALLYGNTNIDSNRDNEIQLNEAKIVKSLDLVELGIRSLIGIESFTALTYLRCDGNQLDTLDLSKNTALTWLQCSNNKLNFLNVSNNAELSFLDCSGNLLTSLDLSKNPVLTKISCLTNQLTTLNVSKNTNLTWLQCDNNKLNSLDVRNNTLLTTFDCSGNLLTNLDLRDNYSLTDIYCWRNPLPYICISLNMLKAIYGGSINFGKEPSTQYNTSCDIITTIEDNYTSTSKKILQILTPLGQNIKPEEQAREGLFIYQYSDGSVKKVMKKE